MTAMANHHSNLIFHRNIKCKRAIFHSKLLARLPGGPFPRNGSLDGLDGPSCASFQLLPAASSCFQLLPAASSCFQACWSRNCQRGLTNRTRHWGNLGSVVNWEVASTKGSVISSMAGCIPFCLFFCFGRCG